MKTPIFCLVVTWAIAGATEVRLHNYTPAALAVTNAAMTLTAAAGHEAVFQWDEAQSLNLSGVGYTPLAVTLAGESVNVVTVGVDSDSNLVAIVSGQHGSWALALTGFAYGFAWGVFGLILRVIKRGASGGIPE